MKKKDYMKPAMRTLKLRHHSIICASPYAGIQSKNSSDSDNPNYDGSSSSNIWDAN